MARESADSGRVRAAVVVDHDDEVGWLEVGDLVEGLIGHATRERAVADDRNHVAIDMFTQPCFGDAEGVAEGGRGVAVLDEVVGGFLARGIPGQAARLAQTGKFFGPARHDLVDVRLVTGVPDDRVLRAVEDPVQGEGQLDDAQVR